MSTDIEEDIKECKETIGNFRSATTELTKDIFPRKAKAIENILADRERLQEDYKILEQNYEMLSENISNIAKKLNLQEDATIDEIHTAISILKSKRINMFEQLECINKANKYDRLKEKIIQKDRELEKKDKIIDELIEKISHYDIDFSEICKKRIVDCNKCEYEKNICIKQYFEKKVEK